MRILHHYFKSFKNHQKSFAIIFVGGILSLIIGPYFLLTRGACDCSSEICVLVSSATTLCSLEENLHFYLPNIVLWTCTKLMFNSQRRQTWRRRSWTGCWMSTSDWISLVLSQSNVCFKELKVYRLVWELFNENFHIAAKPEASPFQIFIKIINETEALL